MSDTPKKQTFLHGTMLLAMSTAIVKLIGACGTSSEMKVLVFIPPLMRSTPFF